MKVELFAGWLFTVTVKAPEEAAAGTTATTVVSDQLVATAAVPLRATVLLPCEAPKPVPVIVTGTPTGPEVGEIFVIVGACARALL